MHRLVSNTVTLHTMSHCHTCHTVTLQYVPQIGVTLSQYITQCNTAHYVTLSRCNTAQISAKLNNVTMLQNCNTVTIMYCTFHRLVSDTAQISVTFITNFIFQNRNLKLIIFPRYLPCGNIFCNVSTLKISPV